MKNKPTGRFAFLEATQINNGSGARSGIVPHYDPMRSTSSSSSSSSARSLPNNQSAGDISPKKDEHDSVIHSVLLHPSPSSLLPFLGLLTSLAPPVIYELSSNSCQEWLLGQNLELYNLSTKQNTYCKSFNDNFQNISGKRVFKKSPCTVFLVCRG